MPTARKARKARGPQVFWFAAAITVASRPPAPTRSRPAKAASNDRTPVQESASHVLVRSRRATVRRPPA